MSAALILSLRAQCDGPRDGALLRFALGQALLSAGDTRAAAAELQRAVDYDPKYSAAWKLLGKAHVANGDTASAKAAWQQGIAAAQGHGDKQAEKEMTVFLRRLPA
jgi:predicted Zn-dependent protease